MLKIISLIIVVALVVLAVVINQRPSDLRITRSITIAASPEVIFPHVNEFKKWEAWSPYAKLDPNMQTTYEGPVAGEGSVYRWNGNNDVGEGQTKIISSKPHESIGIELKFERPFKGTNDVEFTFKPNGGNTVVTWTMTGKTNFISKAMGLVIDMDKMVGGQFDEGLSSLKRVVETEPKN